MSVLITYACGNASSASGSGFSTATNLSGSATTVVMSPPSGATSVTYALSCLNNKGTTGAQCAVQINQPSIILIANPSVVTSGELATVGWITSGMRACTISSPDMPAFTAANASNTSVNGIATTSAISSTVTVKLNCQTLSGDTRTGSVVITTSTAPSSGTILLNTDAGNAVAHGDSVVINWSSSSPPAGSVMSLWLINTDTHTTQAFIVGGLAPNGTYTWHVPTIGAPCAVDLGRACASDLVKASHYAIQAVLYTPSNAHLGGGLPPPNPIAPVYGASTSTASFVVSN